jgi:glyoxylase-like metal-dependent hydrolase (beta-lactamase superfamily II)
MTRPDTIGDGVFATEVALGEYDVRGVLLVGDARAVAWDTLSHPRDMSGWLPLIGSRDLVVVYSHADWDHIWGTAGLPLERATVVMGHRACQARFTADVPRTRCSTSNRPSISGR